MRRTCRIHAIAVVLMFLSVSVSSSTAQQQSITCFDWSGTEHTIADAQINDGYCDCPLTGEDEAQTQACAGNEYWPVGGRRATEVDPDTQKQTFACPEQPNKYLSLSKVNDGICDCCDGADEVHNPAVECPDICEEVLAGERAARQRLEETFRLGYIKRQEEIAKFAQFKIDAQEQIQVKQAALDSIVQQVAQSQQDIAKAKLQILQSRLKDVASATTAAANEVLFLSCLSVNELVWFVIHACQVAGEQASAPARQTCVPLRLAGLDAGLWWQSESYQVTRRADAILKADASAMKETDDTADETQQVVDDIRTFADILHHNLRNDRLVWDKSSWESSSPNRGPNQKRKRRRLEAMDDDFDPPPIDDDFHYPDDDDDDDDDAFGDEHAEIQARLEEEEARQAHGRVVDELDDADNGDGTAASKRQAIMELILVRSFSTSRAWLLDQSARLKERMEKVAREMEEAEERQRKDDEAVGDGETGEETQVEDGGEADENPQSPEDADSFDPVALPMVRNRLTVLEKHVRRGLDYAVSAKVLLDALVASEDYVDQEEQLREDLYQLLLGTLGHGELSALDTWRIYQQGILVASDASERTDSDRETCESPWAASCPPPIVERKSATGTITLPPAIVLPAGKAFCERLYEDATSSDTCAFVEESVRIPSEIPDGFLGYYEIVPRTDGDPLGSVLHAWSLEYEEAPKVEMDELLQREEAIDTQKEDLTQSVDDLRESIGAGNPDKYGTDGELHCLRETCLSINTGKYVYELCPFGSSAQKEPDGAGRGTDLGTWVEQVRDEDSGDRIWKWTGGARCWNGPNRSATAHVTCGKESKILSSDEPEICRYVFQVESPIACDEAFGIKHNLAATS